MLTHSEQSHFYLTGKAKFWKRGSKTWSTRLSTESQGPPLLADFLLNILKAISLLKHCSYCYCSALKSFFFL